METMNVRNDPMDVEMQENGTGNKKAFWRTGERKKFKKSPLEKSISLKKYVQPKSAIMCLNELVPNTTFTVEQEGVPNMSPFCVSVEVNGQRFQGLGTSKQLAKHSAAEAALVSFLKPAVEREDGTVDDTTPWGILACFAMYKLFSDWRDGRIGQIAGSFANPMVQDATISKSIQSGIYPGMMNQNSGMSSGVFNQNMGMTVAGNLIKSPRGNVPRSTRKDPVGLPNPAKQLPENASMIHPVMLLHQMRPQLTYSQSTVVKDNKSVASVSCDIDDNHFTGEGPSLKIAKYELAVKAVNVLFGVVTTYTKG